jgi:hypothetical protein
MYIYNVTIKVETELADEWLKWMKSTHIPEVMKTGYFNDYRISRLLDDGDLEGITFSIQYTTDTVDTFLEYQQKAAPALQRDHIERYGNRVAAFRTIMELIEEG